MPAEWEPHLATWFAWPHADDWPGKAAAIPWVFAEAVRYLAEGERIRILVSSPGERQGARQVLKQARVPLRQVDFVHLPTNRSWTRDYLPSFVTRSVEPANGGRLPKLGAVKWRFNGWARYHDYRLDHATGHRVAEWLGASTFSPEVAIGGRRRRVVLEGGAFDVDGQGTVVVSEQCLLKGRRARCRGLGRAQTERIFSDYLDAPCVLWTERGIAGDDTSGHVDDFVRFVAPGCLVLCHEPQSSDINYRPLRMAHERLSMATDARGRRLEIVSLPMPAPVYFGRERLPASYANFYVGNSVVLVPTFNDPADRVALGTLAELFPNRKVVGIHAADLVLGLGTLHCSTQQEPLTQGRR